MLCGTYEPREHDPEYMAGNVPLAKGYKRFVDAGAYHGENALAIAERFGPLEAVAFVEPDPANMAQLRQDVQSFAPHLEYHECGLWSDDCSQQFHGSGDIGSWIGPGGESMVQCRTIDSILAGFKPTMIKMDIERAEAHALRGGRRVIEADRPDLLVSVYHNVFDIWRLPLLIASWDLGYQYYLREHNPWGIDTVLYAVCAGG